MDGNSTDSSCYPRIIWWLFPVISMWLYTAGLIATILYTVLARVGLSEGVQVNLLKLRNKVSYILSPMNSLLGKVLYTLIFLANVVYLSLAVYRTTQPVYQCVTLFSPTLVVELFVTIFLFLHFFLRLLAAESFLFHWLSILNIVDVLTIFQPLLSLIIGYDWLGLRTLRFLWLTETSKFIHLLPFKNSEDVSQVCKILSQFLGLWLAASGVIQLLESSGDLWNHDDSQHGITFWTSAYFTMVTLSTVGYGDVTMTTVCGRIFITFFIMTGLAVYAVALPTLVDVTLTSFRASRFRRKYTASRYGESILVCGHITAQSVESFLKELLHPDKHDKHTNVLFLHPTSPSSDLRQVLKTYYTRVQFLIGTPLSTKDLHKCQINEAKALIVLADRECLDPIEEDRANLLRAIAVKNTYRPLRVILQLLCHSSKDMLTSIPGWDPKQDVVLCLNELKFNILAQTCITPGFCALVSNLFFATTVHQMASRPGPQLSWKQLYISGACNEVYSTLLSQSFYGMKIGEVARICFEDLGLTLLAIDQDDYYTMNHVIQENATGYFIADTAQDVLKANFYCCSCHTRIIDHSYFDPCACSFDIPSSVPLHHLHSTPILTSPFTVVSLSPQIHLSSNPLFPPIPPTALRNHIVLCVFATKDSTTIGLSCFVTPLQTSSHSIVIITDPTYMAKEWYTMSSHSHIYCVPGSPLDWDCLKKARIAFSSVCVVLSVPAKYKDMSEYGINDKEVVLCTLKLRQQLGNKVTIVTDLAVESHIHLLDSHSQSDQPAYLAEPFACGYAFVSSMFDSLTTVAFHCPGTIALLENILDAPHQSRCGRVCGSIIQLFIDSTHLAQFAGHQYRHLYNYFTTQGVLCIGLYRLLYPGSSHRYIITAPSANLVLVLEDIVFGLKLPEPHGQTAGLPLV